jgi:hypothetical protein
MDHQDAEELDDDHDSMAQSQMEEESVLSPSVRSYINEKIEKVGSDFHTLKDEMKDQMSSLNNKFDSIMEMLKANKDGATPTNVTTRPAQVKPTASKGSRNISGLPTPPINPFSTTPQVSPNGSSFVPISPATARTKSSPNNNRKSPPADFFAPKVNPLLQKKKSAKAAANKAGTTSWGDENNFSQGNPMHKRSTSPDNDRRSSYNILAGQSLTFTTADPKVKVPPFTDSLIVLDVAHASEFQLAVVKYQTAWKVLLAIAQYIVQAVQVKILAKLNQYRPINSRITMAMFIQGKNDEIFHMIQAALAPASSALFYKELKNSLAPFPVPMKYVFRGTLLDMEIFIQALSTFMETFLQLYNFLYEACNGIVSRIPPIDNKPMGIMKLVSEHIIFASQREHEPVVPSSFKFAVNVLRLECPGLLNTHFSPRECHVFLDKYTEGLGTQVQKASRIMNRVWSMFPDPVASLELVAAHSTLKSQLGAANQASPVDGSGRKVTYSMYEDGLQGWTQPMPHDGYDDEYDPERPYEYEPGYDEEWQHFYNVEQRSPYVPSEKPRYDARPNKMMTKPEYDPLYRRSGPQPPFTVRANMDRGSPGPPRRPRPQGPFTQESRDIRGACFDYCKDIKSCSRGDLCEYSHGDAAVAYMKLIAENLRNATQSNVKFNATSFIIEPPYERYEFFCNILGKFPAMFKALKACHVNNALITVGNANIIVPTSLFDSGLSSQHDVMSSQFFAAHERLFLPVTKDFPPIQLLLGDNSAVVSVTRMVTAQVAFTDDLGRVHAALLNFMVMDSGAPGGNDLVIGLGTLLTHFFELFMRLLNNAHMDLQTRSGHDLIAQLGAQAALTSGFATIVAPPPPPLPDPTILTGLASVFLSDTSNLHAELAEFTPPSVIQDDTSTQCVEQNVEAPA